MKKVLIITYYWPPSGGGGVQRWLKFVKYLQDYGWQPIVYTPENPDFELKDGSLEEDVPDGVTILKRPIWEPFSIYRMFLGKKAVQKQGVVSKTSKSFFSRISVWIRGNYFIPDSRIFWVRPSTSYLARYIKQNKIDVLVTTGPPHSLHLIGLEIKKRTNVKWLADFRDPWSKWDVLDQLNLTNRSRKNHQKLEQKVLRGADLILTVSSSLRKSLLELGAEKVEVITNGYDFEIPEASSSLPDKFRISHVGLLNLGRNPLKLWKALNSIAAELPEFSNDLEICLSGTIEDEVISSLNTFSELKNRIVNAGYLEHSKVLETYSKSAILLLLINNTENAKWILPGKMYEYMAQRKPILALGKVDSDASDILEDAGYGACLDYSGGERMKKYILKEYENYKAGVTEVKGGNVEKYHRKELTKSLASCLDQL